jgi:N-acyl-L-homoserine lactone synthetase
MIGWQLFAPPGEAPSGWLEEIREFRARILYDNGRRPAFRQGDGRYADNDRLDRAAHHVSARVAGLVVGCVRLLPVPEGDVCFTEQLVGAARFAEMLSDLGVHRSQTIEGGRWVVDPTHRASRLGVLLAAGGLAVARASGYRMLCCPVGTGRKQDRVLARLGWAPVPDVPLIAVPQLNDELRVMHIFPTRAAEHVRVLMDTMAVELKLPSTQRLEDDQASRITTSTCTAASLGAGSYV